MVKIAVILALIQWALPVQAMVYLWKDTAGVVHYTNREHEVPQRYKAKARKIYPEAADVAQPPVQTGGQPSPMVLQQPVPASPQQMPVVPPQVPGAKGPPPAVAVPQNPPNEPPKPRKKVRAPRERDPEDNEEHN